LLTRTKVCFIFNRCSFKYCVSMSPLMYRSKGRCLVISSFYHTNISFIINSFFYNTMYSSWIITSYNCPLFTVLVNYTIDNLGTHLFWCPCGNERTTVHDTFRDTIVAIALESEAHVEREVSHFFPCHIRQQVDILIIRDGFEFWWMLSLLIQFA
jgi:hypothetical protein